MGEIKMVSQAIGHSSVVMTEKNAKCNLRRFQDDFPSLRERIALRLTPPMEDSYFTNLEHLNMAKSGISDTYLRDTLHYSDT